MTGWVTLRLPSAAYVVGIARSMAVAAAASAQVPEDRIDDVRTCTSEAVTNAVQAHRRIEVTLPIVVRTTTDGGRFVLEVGDSGPGLDPQVPPNGTVDALREGGYGIPVMRALADSFDIASGGILDAGVGTTVRMTYRLDPAA
ncbi:ATP-binding protein [Euzebya sp.]|uniref:ATP-binding protein n=1 Tax=Euzebya sp. TaxID=1971409 RepID=UPI0035137C69